MRRGHTNPSATPLHRHSRTPPLSFPQYLSGNPYWIMPALILHPPPSFLHPPAVIPAPLRRHSRTPRRHSRIPPAVIPAVFKRESILDYAGVNPAYAMLQDAQFGYLYPFTDYHKHLLFCDLPLSTATGSTTTGPTDWSTTTPKYPSFPLATNPIQCFIHQ